MGMKKETKVRDLDIIKPGNNFLVLVKRSLDEIFTLKTYQVQYCCSQRKETSSNKSSVCSAMKVRNGTRAVGSCEAASEAASQKLDLLVIPITIMINWEELVNAEKSRRGNDIIFFIVSSRFEEQKKRSISCLLYLLLINEWVSGIKVQMSIFGEGFGAGIVDRNQLWKQFFITRNKKDNTYRHNEMLLGNGERM
ncbi:hypothetical protein Q9966_003185 [Columba livia]|nr:hypothetical protein Q9966_003185 [Columba livia]